MTGHTPDALSSSKDALASTPRSSRRRRRTLFGTTTESRDGDAGGEAPAARSGAPRYGAERLSGGAAERRFRVQRAFRRSEGGEGLLGLV